ncbi:ectopic P granules protein 5 homolog [Uloborus diversus]|uniref:ectopic P granules protein 5 homolog n=1 Tax=Uloborus diversus TaxID=327109 RepID=UPI0024098F62|nr:ectopic P granules protein 5 homolog [Uloborus diversus]
MSLLQQVSITRIYNHILLLNEGGTVSVKLISERDMLKFFAYSTALINVLFMGLENYCEENTISSYDYICHLLRHTVGYVSDYWQNYIKSNGSIKPAFQAEYDRFLFHAVYKIFHFQKLGIWKCLSKLPLNSVSRKMFWNILWLFHHSDGTEEEIYSAKDADRRLLDVSEQMRFFQMMKMYEEKNAFHILNLYEKIALSCNGDEEIINFLIHEICEVSFFETCSRDKFCKEAIVAISHIVKTYPQLASFLLKEFDGKDDEVNSCALKLFKEINLLRWKPDKKDLAVLSEWLLSSTLSQPQNHLARLIIIKLNWNYDAMGSLILPLQMHQEVAVLLVKAYLKFDADGNRWIVSRGLDQMLQFASIETHVKEDEGFIHWVWETLFSLKLHVLDKTFPSWVQIYDGFIDTGNIPDLLEDVFLTPLQHAFEAKHPAACYVVLAMTRIGHSVEDLMKQGLQCLSILVQHQQYPAAIRSLYYMLPFFVKKSDHLLLETEFLKSMNYLITADMSVLSSITGGAVKGIVLQKLAAMIKLN